MSVLPSVNAYCYTIPDYHAPSSLRNEEAARSAPLEAAGGAASSTNSGSDSELASVPRGVELRDVETTQLVGSTEQQPRAERPRHHDCVGVGMEVRRQPEVHRSAGEHYPGTPVVHLLGRRVQRGGVSVLDVQ